MNAMPRPYFSHSQQSAYLACGKKYYFQYFLKLAREEKAFFAIGNLVDSTLQFHYENMLLKANLDPLEDVFEQQFKELWEESEAAGTPGRRTCAAGNTDDGDPKRNEFLEALEECYPPLKKAIGDYIHEVQQWEPLSLQEKIEVRLPELIENGMDIPIHGYIDMVARHKESGELYVIDFKTAGRRSKISYSNRKQLMLYNLAIAKKYGEMPKNQHHIFYKKFFKTPKNAPCYDLIDIEILPEEYHFLGIEYVESIRGIQLGYFPRNRDHMFCSAEGCDYYEFCHNEMMEEKDVAI